MLGLSFLCILMLFAYGKPDWRPILVGYLGLLLQGGCLLAIGAFVSTCTKNQIVAGVATFAICLLLWILDWMSAFDTSVTMRVIAYLSVLGHFDSFSKGRAGYQGRHLLSVCDFRGIVSDGALDGVAAVEGVI